ncbi:hypothetical protein NP511_03015 [Natrinema thermotolerans]|uniref:Uncharacterized protein n=1 Tax=Natrinema thermotolerans TaxID=121872 RepID=A0AAF0SZP5_9EURY|nr:hypothetical protein [Natrinema thermotolerans]QCC57533.1 hypothetical protein DVR14_02300 [Natrinema thermotolerans]WMT08611.1 hypothetical protein NP511_03015 [Natrinema thermotolerans]
MFSTLRTILVAFVGMFVGTVAAAAIVPDPTSLLGMTITLVLVAVFSYAAYHLDERFAGNSSTNA